MPYRYLAGLTALVLLLIASLGLKYANSLAAREPNIPKMRGEMAAVLEDAGYTVKLGRGSPKWWTDGLVTGRKSSCEISLRDATIFGPEYKAISARRMNEGRPIRYIWNGSYITAYPRIRIEALWRTQRELSRLLGLRYGIDPVIAIGAADGCWPDPALFRSVQIYYGR